jgi:hypothetical protein
MRRGKTNKLTRRYDPGFLPESWEMLLIARHQIVRFGSIGTHQEYIVIGVICHFKLLSRSYGVAVVLGWKQPLEPSEGRIEVFPTHNVRFLVRLQRILIGPAVLQVVVKS